MNGESQDQGREGHLHDQEKFLKGWKLRKCFIGLSFALLVQALDQNSTGVALPTIGSSLDCSATVMWVGISYLIANTAFQPLYGRLSDIWGRKSVLMASLLVLASGNLASGFARTGPQLYGFRAISGLANGGVTGLAMIIISDVVSLEKRGKYQGFVGCAVGLGNSIGPFITAGFARHSSWRHMFHFTSGLCPLATLVVFFLVPSTTPTDSALDRMKKFDFLGFLLSTVSIPLFLIPISGFRTQFDPSSPMAIEMLTLGGLLFALFLFNEWKIAKIPIIPLRLLKNGNFAVLFVQNVLIGTVYQSMLNYLPVYFQSAKQMSILQSAVLILPLVLCQAISSIVFGVYTYMTQRYVEIVWLGFGLWAIGLGCQQLFTSSFPISHAIVILGVTGWGVGFIFQPLLVASQAVTKKEDRAVVVSARNFARGFGASIGMAIGSPIFGNTLFKSLPADIPEDVLEAIKSSIFVLPPLKHLDDAQEAEIYKAYDQAADNLLFLWLGEILLCFLLAVFIRDRGLQRNKEGQAGLEVEVEVEVEAREDDGREKRSQDVEMDGAATKGMMVGVRSAGLGGTRRDSRQNTEPESAQAVRYPSNETKMV